MISTKTGVYRIRNVINGKCYIGSAGSKGGFRSRWSKHRSTLTGNTHHSAKLQHAWNKYRADAFVFEIILFCDPENCVMYEQIALDHIRPDYNICATAGSWLGRKHSQATKDKLSRFQSGRKRGAHSDVSKKRMSRAAAGHSRARGTNNGRVKINQEIADTIRVELANGARQVDLASKYGVTQTLVSMIKLNKIWQSRTGRFSV